MRSRPPVYKAPKVPRLIQNRRSRIPCRVCRESLSSRASSPASSASSAARASSRRLVSAVLWINIGGEVASRSGMRGGGALGGGVQGGFLGRFVTEDLAVLVFLDSSSSSSRGFWRMEPALRFGPVESGHAGGDIWKRVRDMGAFNITRRK